MNIPNGTYTPLELEAVTTPEGMPGLEDLMECEPALSLIYDEYDKGATAVVIVDGTIVHALYGDEQAASVIGTTTTESKRVYVGPGAPMIATPKLPTFAVGDRVRITQWGRYRDYEGTVTDVVGNAGDGYHYEVDNVVKWSACNLTMIWPVASVCFAEGSN